MAQLYQQSHFAQTVLGQANEVERKLHLPNLEPFEKRALVSRKKALRRQVVCSPALQAAIREIMGIPEPKVDLRPVRVTSLNRRGQAWGE